MDESNDGATDAKYPRLEARTNRSLSYGEESERAKHEKERAAEENVAFYLIEREAILLRRFRWATSEKDRAFSERVDQRATALQNAWPSTPKTREERLAQYARPCETTAEDSPVLLKRSSNALSRRLESLFQRFRRKRSGDERKDSSPNKGVRE